MIVELASGTSQRYILRSSSANPAVIQRTRTRFDKRTFSVCDPSTWNSLQSEIHTTDS